MFHTENKNALTLLKLVGLYLVWLLLELIGIALMILGWIYAALDYCLPKITEELDFQLNRLRLAIERLKESME